MTGCRTKRIARVAQALPDITKQLADYTSEVHGYNPMDGGPVFHVDRNSLESVWFATPFEQTRDSEALTRSNFEVIGADLARVSLFGTDVNRFGHWGHGWYERIYVRRDDATALKALEEWTRALADYPVADEMHYSDLEWSENHPFEGECYGGEDCSCRDA